MTRKTLLLGPAPRISLILSFLLLAGCMTPPRWHEPVVLERSAGTQATQLSVSEGKTEAPSAEEIRMPAAERKISEKRRPINARRLMLGTAPVSLNAEGMPLSDFIIYALGEGLKVPFVMDEAMMNNKKPVSLRMPQAVSADKALDVILGVLEKEGVVPEERDGALYLLQGDSDGQGPGDVRVGTSAGSGSAETVQVVPLRYVRPAEVEPLIRDLFKNVQVKPFARENILVLSGKGLRMKPVLDFIATFDVPYFQDRKLFLLHLTYWQSEEFISQLSKIMEGIGYPVAKTPREQGLFFIPVKQLNAVLAVTPDAAAAGAVMGWMGKLDTPEAAGTELKAYTYLPKYSRASELIASIHNLYRTSGDGKTTDAQKNTSARAEETSKSMTPTQSADPSKPAETPKETSFEAPGLKVAADDRKNMVLILGKPDAYRNLLNLLQTLDVPARQVLIEATIVELTLTDELKYGMEWYIKNSFQGGTYNLGTLGNLGVKSTTGLSYSFLSGTGQFQSLISALAEADKANILSTPRLMVLDNTEADIQVGKDVPIITGEISSVDSSTSSSTNVYNSIQYRSTGVMLKVKPTINTDGLLTLEITQEVSDISDTAGVSGSPIILTRKVNTTIVAAHGQTIALGGLMKENLTQADSKVPLLGDIPLLGNFFKYSAKTKEKTELLVLVTPTILTSPDDAATVSSQLRRDLGWFQ